MQQMGAAQDSFRRGITAHWAAIKVGDAKEASRQSKIVDDLVAEWPGQEVEILTQFLDDAESPEVRCAAATYILYSGHSDISLPILEAIAEKEGIGLVSGDANLILLNWRKRTGTR